jgi:hypothetical protein
VPNPVRVPAFTGMNNVSKIGQDLKTPSILLNADVSKEGVLSQRQGYAKVVTLAGAHSLWSGSVMLCGAGDGNLYRINNTVATSLASGAGTKPIYFVEINGNIYISSALYTGVYNIGSETVSSWGLALPNVGPQCTSGGGGLLPGTYHLAFTTLSGGEISGNGPVVRFDLSNSGGIVISNRPADAIVWCSDVDGSELFFAGAVDTVNDVGMERLPSFGKTPPPNMEHICYAFGRIWGSVGDVLHYSDPLAYSWFGPSGRIPVDGNILMIAPVTGGIFLGFSDRIDFLVGREPSQMAFEYKVNSKGVIENTLQYVDSMPEIGSDIPIWTGKGGIYAGMLDGTILDLTRKRITFNAPKKAGASLIQMLADGPRYLSAFEQPTDVGFGDSATCEVVRNGRVLQASWYDEVREVMGTSDWQSLFEETSFETITMTDTVTDS